MPGGGYRQQFKRQKMNKSGKRVINAENINIR